MGESQVRDRIRVIVPTGMLGAGSILAEDVRRGVAQGADAIACDSGSTDSGASFLARGVSKNTRQSVKRDLQVLVVEAAAARIPLLIGTCGMGGADPAVEWTRDIVLEVAAEHGLQPRIACLFSEQPASVLKSKNREGRISALKPSPDLDDAVIDSCDRIVALMGPEPYIAALTAGADIVLGGRTSDPAVLAALPLARGADPALAWHASKLAECGSMCTVNPRRGGVLVTLGEGWFEISPLSPDNACTPGTVSSHMLYENSNPLVLTEPGGVLDVTDAVYEAVDARVVRVTGARWIERPYTMKLEGARGGPFQTLMLVGIEDPHVLANLDLFGERLEAALRARIVDVLGDAAGAFDVSLRLYGWNGVSGRPPGPQVAPPPEVGVLLVVTAATQELATTMAKVCNSIFFHFPLEDGRELPSYAFPFSPAEAPRGQVYEFVLNHVVEVDHPLELVRTEWAGAAAATARVAQHA